MNVRDLIPWNRSSRVPVRHAEDGNPFLPLHREMNRLFDEVFRGFDVAPFGFGPRLQRRLVLAEHRGERD